MQQTQTSGDASQVACRQGTGRNTYVDHDKHTWAWQPWPQRRVLVRVPVSMGRVHTAHSDVRGPVPAPPCKGCACAFVVCLFDRPQWTAFRRRTENNSAPEVTLVHATCTQCTERILRRQKRNKGKDGGGKCVGGDPCVCVCLCVRRCGSVTGPENTERDGSDSGNSTAHSPSQARNRPITGGGHQPIGVGTPGGRLAVGRATGCEPVKECASLSVGFTFRAEHLPEVFPERHCLQEGSIFPSVI